MEEIDTPALLIDLDALEKNIRTVADYYRSKKGAALLPHQKGHRLPIVAKKQMDAGAKGVTMTSLGLTEHYVLSGIYDILITAEICGRGKIRKLCDLSKVANITASVDNIQNVRQLSDEAIRNNARINVAVELYTGKRSCGIEIEKTKTFVKELVKFRGLNFRGFWLLGPEAKIKSLEERKKSHFAWLDKLAELKDDVEDAGIDVEMLSSGQTCTWNITPEYSGLSDVGVQAGSYVFSDWCSHEYEGLEVFDYALTVLTRCISRPRPDEAMFDFGLNSCSDEETEDYAKVVGPKFKNVVVKEISMREEIALAVLSEPSKDVRVGDVFELIPSHSDTTAKLYDNYYAMRKGKIEAVWPNYGRGLF